jgi:SPP1 gp7 family putative phage head morphogenesis protein
MPSELQLADDYAEALKAIEARAVVNTTAALQRSLMALLKNLRRYYGQYVDASLPDQQSADGVTRRPGSYSIQDGSAKFAELIKLSQGFVPDSQLRAIERALKTSFEEAVALGGDLGQRLAREADPSLPDPKGVFVGASKEAIKAAAATATAYIRGEVESFRDNVTRIVTDGIGQGVGPRKLEQQIRTALLGAKDPQGLNNIMGLRQRAELIARSEVANAYVDAQKASAARNGFAYGRWIATKDERTCPVCASRHGRIYRLDQMVGTLHPRCRCSLSPVSTDAVEESDPKLRAVLLRDDYWEKAREQLTNQFANAKNWPFERASKVLEDAVLKPSASEKRRYPGIKRAPQPVG